MSTFTLSLLEKHCVTVVIINYPRCCWVVGRRLCLEVSFSIYCPCCIVITGCHLLSSTGQWVIKDAKSSTKLVYGDDWSGRNPIFTTLYINLLLHKLVRNVHMSRLWWLKQRGLMQHGHRCLLVTTKQRALHLDYMKCMYMICLCLHIANAEL